MARDLVGPFAGMVTDRYYIQLYCERGYEGRIRNCADLYFTIAKMQLASRPADAPNPCMCPLDAPNDERVFAQIELKGQPSQ